MEFANGSYMTCAHILPVDYYRFSFAHGVQVWSKLSPRVMIKDSETDDSSESSIYIDRPPGNYKTRLWDCCVVG